MAYHIPDESPDDPRVFLGYIEFYVTNVCNLNCTNCNRFNNHDFRGWQNWHDYEQIYQAWSQHIRFQKIAIMGGEPLLNPTICDWVDGLNRLWNKRVQIMTNGTRLTRVPGLYDRLVRFREQGDHYRGNWIGVSIHNTAETDALFDNIREWLSDGVRYYHKDDVNNINNCNTWGADHAFVDQNEMRVHVWDYTSFYPAAVHLNEQGRFTLYNNDADTAHSTCGFAQFKCHHFIKGKLYKCGPVALMPEFDQQHRLDIGDEDRALLNAYQPLTLESASQTREFVNGLDDVIPQCKFCPVLVPGQNQVIKATSKRANSTGIF